MAGAITTVATDRQRYMRYSACSIGVLLVRCLDTWQDDRLLIRWMIAKYRSFRKKKTYTGKYLARIADAHPGLFVHWHMGIRGAFVYSSAMNRKVHIPFLEESVGKFRCSVGLFGV